jgi:hypothetical protein
MPRANEQVRNQRVSSYQARIERSLTDIFFEVPSYERMLREDNSGVSWTLVSVGHTNGWAVCELCGHRPIRRLFWIAPVANGNVDESRMLMIGSECAREYARVDLVNSYLNRLTREQSNRREATRREEQQAEWRREREERAAQWRGNNADVIEWLSDESHLVDRRHPDRTDSFLQSLADTCVHQGRALTEGQTRSVRSNMEQYEAWFAERASAAVSGPDPDLQRLIDEEAERDILTGEAARPIREGNFVRRMASGRIASCTDRNPDCIGVAMNDAVRGETVRIAPLVAGYAAQGITTLRGIEGVEFYRPQDGDRIRFLGDSVSHLGISPEVANALSGAIGDMAESISRDIDREILFGTTADTTVVDEPEQDSDEAEEAQAMADNTPATADDARMVYNGSYTVSSTREDAEVMYLIYTVRSGPLSGQRVIKARIGGVWKGFAFLTRSGHMRLWRRFQERNDDFVEWLPAFGQLVNLFSTEPITTNRAGSNELSMEIYRNDIRCRICNAELSGMDRRAGIHMETFCVSDRWTPRNPAPQAEASAAEDAARAADMDLRAAQARAIRRPANTAGRRRGSVATLPAVEALPPLALDELGHGEVL